MQKGFYKGYAGGKVSRDATLPLVDIIRQIKNALMLRVLQMLEY